PRVRPRHQSADGTGNGLCGQSSTIGRTALGRAAGSKDTADIPPRRLLLMFRCPDNQCCCVFSERRGSFLLQGAADRGAKRSHPKAIRQERFASSIFACERILSPYRIAKTKGYVLPTVFQCSYSIVAQHHEAGLSPTARRLNTSNRGIFTHCQWLSSQEVQYVEQGLETAFPTQHCQRDSAMPIKVYEG
ncbi:hypothetical protein CCMA1212_004887, partial [Trichoderma ghanense]